MSGTARSEVSFECRNHELRTELLVVSHSGALDYVCLLSILMTSSATSKTTTEASFF